MSIERSGSGGVTLLDGDALVAQGVPTSLNLDVPAAVSLAEAEVAAQSYSGLEDHPFPRCFVCGTDRAEGDGLQIFAGPVAGRNILAAPWSPNGSVLDEEGNVLAEFLWAALDCPGGFAVMEANGNCHAVLGRMAARLMRPVAGNERWVVVGWVLRGDGGADGRKLHAGSAIFSRDGDLHALARAVWIKLG